MIHLICLVLNIETCERWSILINRLNRHARSWNRNISFEPDETSWQWYQIQYMMANLPIHIYIYIYIAIFS